LILRRNFSKEDTTLEDHNGFLFFKFLNLFSDSLDRLFCHTRALSMGYFAWGKLLFLWYIQVAVCPAHSFLNHHHILHCPAHAKTPGEKGENKIPINKRYL
jgi:hypothetical protein